MISLTASVRECLESGPHWNESGAVEAVYVFPADFIGFSGHFPQKAVLPGIAQIMAVSCLLGDSGCPPLRSVKRCKFLRVVSPLERLAISAQVTRADERMEVQAGLSVQGETCASMTLIFDAAETLAF